MAKGALLDVVDAAWRLDRDRSDWMNALVGAAAGGLPPGIGGAAYHFRVQQGQPVLTAWSGHVHLSAIPARFHKETPAAEILASYGLDPEGKPLFASAMAEFSRDLFPRAVLPRALHEEYRGVGLEDALLFVVNDVGGEHFKLVMPLPSLATDPQLLSRYQQMRKRWAPVVRHLERALRLKHALSTGATSVAAQLDANGRGEFADPGQRGEILEALAREQHSRRALTSNDPHTSLTAWDQLLHGRFSIVRSQEGDGKVRFMAIENDPEAGVLRMLTPQERVVVERVAAGESNKVIAIDLGLAPSSVANMLKQAMTKMGVRERVHLPRLAQVMRRQ